MIKLRDVMPDTIIKQVAENAVRQRVIDIRAGKIITQGYKLSTIKKRRKRGLQTSFVDLTGNSAYSKHNWRLLDSWHIEVQDKKAIVRWNSVEAERMYGYQVRRFGDVFKRR